MTVTIALDVMGGDHGAKTLVPAALESVALDPNLEIILVGDELQINEQLSRFKERHNPAIKLRATSQIVTMDESAAHALRNKKDSSMRVAINLVQQGSAQACVSAGNTGALMATGRFVLKMIQGIDRPAIVTSVPTQHNFTHILDLGANVDCSPEHLVQFGLMGSVLIKSLYGISRPKVALLNIGSEEIKGNEQVRLASDLLAEIQAINYVGFIEGNTLFFDPVDVVVCDGFAGNIALKTMEGTSKLIGGFIKTEFESTLASKLAGFASKQVLDRVRRRIDPREYNGATLIGLNGIVLKSHGDSDEMATVVALKKATQEVNNDVLSRIRHEVYSIIMHEAG